MTSSNQCSVCQKAVGVCICVGCKACFCGHDFENHRGGLLHELDVLSEDSNILRDKVNKTPENNELNNPILLRIDQWEQITIEKVKQAAGEARKNATELVESKRKELTDHFEALSHELQELRKTQGFIEQDLTRPETDDSSIEQRFRKLSSVIYYRTTYESSRSNCLESAHQRQK